MPEIETLIPVVVGVSIGLLLYFVSDQIIYPPDRVHAWGWLVGLGWIFVAAFFWPERTDEAQWVDHREKLRRSIVRLIRRSEGLARAYDPFTKRQEVEISRCRQEVGFAAADLIEAAIQCAPKNRQADLVLMLCHVQQDVVEELDARDQSTLFEALPPDAGIRHFLARRYSND